MAVKISDSERSYVVWLNRAFDFYTGARRLYLDSILRPAAYNGAIAIELVLKATIIYYDSDFNPKKVGHNIAKLEQVAHNLLPSTNKMPRPIPENFYFQQRYGEVSRYPRDDGGLVLPHGFLQDLDDVFVDYICAVPFQFNSMLVHALKGDVRYAGHLASMEADNRNLDELKTHVQKWIG